MIFHFIMGEFWQGCIFLKLSQSD